MEPPTGTNGGPFVRVGGSTRDKKPLSPTLAWLAVGPRTKGTFCPGPKGNGDKWPGTKAYSVVVYPCNNSIVYNTEMQSKYAENNVMHRIQVSKKEYIVCHKEKYPTNHFVRLSAPGALKHLGRDPPVPV